MFSLPENDTEATASEQAHNLNENVERPLEISAQHRLRIQLQGSPVSREDLSGEDAAPFRGSRGDGSDIQMDDVSVRAENVPDSVSKPVAWHGQSPLPTTPSVAVVQPVAVDPEGPEIFWFWTCGTNVCAELAAIIRAGFDRGGQIHFQLVNPRADYLRGSYF